MAHSEDIEYCDVCGSILFGEWCQTCEPVIEDDELLEHTTEEVEEET